MKRWTTVTIRKSGASNVRDENELLQWWSAQRRRGETVGVYWALMTHPRVTGELRQRIVGELYGLTYLEAGSSPASHAD